MRYLFFDIECCDGVHICEFGYVLADEEFNVLEQKVMIINPESPFSILTGHNGSEIKLFFTEEQYFSAPIFPTFYRRIKELVEAPEQIVVGHAMINDAEFLRTATTRYDLPPLVFNFLDTQRLYREYINNTDRVSLENLEEELGLEKVAHLHKSDEDALLTMRLFENLCKRLNFTPEMFVKQSLTSRGYSQQGRSGYYGGSFEEMFELVDKNLELLPQKSRRRLLNNYIDRLTSAEETDLPLYGKTVCFSKDIENESLRDTIILIGLIYSAGGRYDGVVSNCNIFVATDEELALKEPKERTRYRSVCFEKRRYGKKTRVMSIRDFCRMLSLEPSMLADMPMPTPPPKKRDREGSGDCVFSCGSAEGTIGDMMRAKGIDLVALFSGK